MNIFELIWHTVILSAICYTSIYLDKAIGAPIYLSVPLIIGALVFVTYNGAYLIRKISKTNKKVTEED